MTPRRLVAQAIAATSRLLAARWTVPILAILLWEQAVCLPSKGTLAQLVSGSFVFHTHHRSSPWIFYVERLEDGRVALSFDPSKSESDIARFQCAFQPIARQGLWATTSLRIDSRLYFMQGELNLTDADRESIRLQLASVFEGDSARAPWVQSLRRGEGTTHVPRPWGYALNVPALLTFGALFASIAARARIVLGNRRLRRSAEHLAAGRCPSCLYPIAGLPDSRCPECGWNRPATAATESPEAPA